MNANSIEPPNKACTCENHMGQAANRWALETGLQSKK